MDVVRKLWKTETKAELPISEQSDFYAIKNFARDNEHDQNNPKVQCSMRAKKDRGQSFLYAHAENGNSTDNLIAESVRTDRRKLAAKIIAEKIVAAFKDEPALLENEDVKQVLDKFDKKGQYGKGKEEIPATQVRHSLRVVHRVLIGESIDQKLRGQAGLTLDGTVQTPAAPDSTRQGGKPPKVNERTHPKRKATATGLEKRVHRLGKKSKLVRKPRNPAFEEPSIPTPDLTQLRGPGSEGGTAVSDEDYTNNPFADVSRQAPNPEPGMSGSKGRDSNKRTQPRRAVGRLSQPVERMSMTIRNMAKRLSQPVLRMRDSKSVRPDRERLVLNSDDPAAFDQLFTYLERIHGQLHQEGKSGDDGVYRWTDLPLRAEQHENGDVTIYVHEDKGGKRAPLSQGPAKSAAFVDVLVKVMKKKIAENQGLSENQDVKLVLKVIGKKAAQEKTFGANDARFCMEALSSIVRGSQSGVDLFGRTRAQFAERFQEFIDGHASSADTSDDSKPDLPQGGVLPEDVPEPEPVVIPTKTPGSIDSENTHPFAFYSADPVVIPQVNALGRAPKRTHDTNPFADPDPTQDEVSAELGTNPFEDFPNSPGDVSLPAAASRNKDAGKPDPQVKLAHIDCSTADAQELKNFLQHSKGCLRGYKKLDKDGKPVHDKDGAPVIVLRVGRRQARGFWGDLVDRFWDWFERDTLRERARAGWKQVTRLDLDPNQSLAPDELLKLLQPPSADWEGPNLAAAPGSEPAVPAKVRNVPPLQREPRVTANLSPREKAHSMNSTDFKKVFEGLTEFPVEKVRRRWSMKAWQLGTKVARVVGNVVEAGPKKEAKKWERKEKELRDRVMRGNNTVPWDSAVQYLEVYWKTTRLPGIDPMTWIKLLRLSKDLQDKGIRKTLDDTKDFEPFRRFHTQ